MKPLWYFKMYLIAFNMHKGILFFGNVENQTKFHFAARMGEGLDCTMKEQTNFRRRLGPWFRYQKLQDRSHQGIHRTSTRR